MLWDSSCGPFTIYICRPRIRLTDWFFCWDIIPDFQCSSSSRKYSLTSSVLQVTGLVARASPSTSDSSREIRPVHVYVYACLIQLTTLFLFSDHFQSSVELLKGVDKYIIKYIISDLGKKMLYIQANHELIDGQYIAYCAYLFSARWFMMVFLDSTACILRFLVPI